MSEPLTIDQLKRVKKGTVLWAVLKSEWYSAVLDPKYRSVRKFHYEKALIISHYHNFYTNYWDAYKALRKLQGATG